MRGDDVHILSGVHGYANGKTKPHARFFEEDVVAFGYLPGVKVYDLPSMTPGAVKEVLNGPGTIIGGFCNSGVCLAPYK